MQKFMQSLYNLVMTWQPLVWMLAAIALFAVGIMCMVPSEEVKKTGRRLLPWIAIGCGLALGATVIAKEISSAFVF